MLVGSSNSFLRLFADRPVDVGVDAVERGSRSGALAREGPQSNPGKARSNGEKSSGKSDDAVQISFSNRSAPQKTQLEESQNTTTRESENEDSQNSEQDLKQSSNLQQNSSTASASATDDDAQERQAEDKAKKEAEKEAEEAEKEAEDKQIEQLEKRDKEVRAHEQSHSAVGGSAAGSPSYDLESGPNGRQYATGGEVSIKLPGGGSPEQVKRDAEQVKRAALAPAQPSSQDRSVAAKAGQIATQAQAEINQEKTEELEAAKEEQQQKAEELQESEEVRSDKGIESKETREAGSSDPDKDRDDIAEQSREEQEEKRAENKDRAEEASESVIDTAGSLVGGTVSLSETTQNDEAETAQLDPRLAAFSNAQSAGDGQQSRGSLLNAVA